ncbi:MAG TPA: NAD-dependent epimerase/dehydratase family protein [Candidatus Dormibacteraeota bacterium]|nr:NAD-dependent epimerase/dehydratase family protein [Candidatus Dormibacteraeota bacterium]
MRVLVAGGAGFVGNHLCRRLLRDGHHVVCVDNLLTGRRTNVADLDGAPGFEFLEADAARTPHVAVDAIVHLASPASPVDYERLPLETMAANSLGTWRLLELAADTGAVLTFVSTSEIYGDPLIHPQPETYWGNVDPIGPRACYDESKRFGEALVTSFRRVRGVRAAIVRVFNTYGPAMRLDDGRVMPEFLGAALTGKPMQVHGDGRQTRSFMYVDDLVDALLLVALDPAADGLVLNVGNEEEVTIAELAELIATEVGRGATIAHLPAREGDPMQRRPDITRIRERYGWQPSVPLADGLRRTAAWYRALLAPQAAAASDQHGSRRSAVA